MSPACPVPLVVGGIEPLTTVDFPGKLSAVIFCQGCPWRCVYCHNPHLQVFRGKETPPWTECMEFLQRRRSFLEAVVFSGGEPTAQSALPSAICQVGRLGFEVGIHTGGMFPAALRSVLPAVHWVGLDVKAPFTGLYDVITGVPDSARRVRKSLEEILKAGVPVQVRTTWDKRYLRESDMEEIDRMLSGYGLPATVRQKCNTSRLLAS